MTTFEVMVDDVVKQEADSLFASLELDTATAIQIFLKASIANAGIPFPVRIVCYIALRQGAIYKPQIAPVNVRLCHNQVPLSYKFYVLS